MWPVDVPFGGSITSDYFNHFSSKFFSVRVVQLWNKLPEEVASVSSVSVLISRLNSMHVSFLMFRFSAVCFFIYASFRVFGQMQVLFLSLFVQSTQFCSLLFLLYLSVLMNKIGKVRYWSLTSLNITQMISDNHCRVYYEINLRFSI